MTKQPEDWLDDVPGDDIEDEDDEIIWVSKSEIKRDAEELKRLGAELVDLGKNALDKIPLDADLRAAIELAQRIKMEGRRRQLQLIGKMLRQRDVDPIRQALDKLKNRHNQQVVVFHKLEQLRDRMVDGSDEAIEEVMNLWPDADRQQLRSLVRNARKEKAATSRQNLPARSSSICVNWRKTRLIPQRMPIQGHHYNAHDGANPH
jgi:ribosome-associated protein